MLDQHDDIGSSKFSDVNNDNILSTSDSSYKYNYYQNYHVALETILDKATVTVGTTENKFSEIRVPKFELDCLILTDENS